MILRKRSGRTTLEEAIRARKFCKITIFSMPRMAWRSKLELNGFAVQAWTERDGDSSLDRTVTWIDRIPSSNVVRPDRIHLYQLKFRKLSFRRRLKCEFLTILWIKFGKGWFEFTIITFNFFIYLACYYIVCVKKK